MKTMKKTAQTLKSLSHEEIVKVLGQLPNFDTYKFVANVFNKISEDKNDDAIYKILKQIEYKNHLSFEYGDFGFSFKLNRPSISKSYLDDFIWMSYRYCIGRRTIAAAIHADTIKSAIEQNKEIFSEDRLGFYARDIRDCINSILHWRDDVSIEGFNNNFDAYSELLYEASKHDNPNELKFTIDTATQTIYTDPLGKKQTPTDYDYCDFVRWTKLANYLDVDCHRIVVTNYQNKIEEHECYPFPIQRGNNKYEQVWCPLDANLAVDRYVAPEYIIEIKKLLDKLNEEV